MVMDRLPARPGIQSFEQAVRAAQPGLQDLIGTELNTPKRSIAELRTEPLQPDLKPPGCCAAVIATNSAAPEAAPEACFAAEIMLFFRKWNVPQDLNPVTHFAWLKVFCFSVWTASLSS